MDKKDFKGMTLMGVILISSAAIIFNLDRLLPYLSSFAEAVLLPPFLALCIAFVVYIPSEKIKRGLSRFMEKGTGALSVFLSILLILLLLVLVIRFIVPELVNAVRVLISSVTAFSSKVEEYMDSPQPKPEWLVTLTETMGEQATAFIDDFKQRSAQYISSFMQGTVNAISQTLSTVVSFFVSLVLAIYFITSKELLLRHIRKLSLMIFSGEKSSKLASLVNLSSAVFRRFITAQCTEALILGTLCALGCLILRLPYAIMIGVLTGVTALVPIYGAFAGALTGGFIIAVQNPMQGLIFLIFFVILQQLEGNLIYPRVVGSSMGLPSVYTFIAVTIGGGLMGIVGMLFAVPLATILYRLISQKAESNT